MDTIALGGVSNVFYFVADLAGATAWYRELLGAEPRRTMPQLVEFDVGGGVLTLHADDELNAGRAGIGTVAYWTTPDVDARGCRAAAAGSGS
jgi:catechol 2,3-dioxygenase-like lactoylglutathione lyase family enzyme